MTAGAVPAAVFAQVKAPETLTRVGAWKLDYDNDACHLQAVFGAGKEKVILRMTHFDLGDEFGLSLYGSRFTSSDAVRNTKIDFGLRGQLSKS
jgi:hypothetical protein